MLTEDEAKTKWCPHAVASHTDPRGHSKYKNERLGLPEDTFVHACIGSACMAWRWADGPHDDVDGDTRLDGTVAKAQGYCGLAGPAS